MIDLHSLYGQIKGTRLASWQEKLASGVQSAFDISKNKDLAHWHAIVSNLPVLRPSSLHLQTGTIKIGEAADCTEPDRAELRRMLMQLHPWRKGPFEILGIQIDTEWRSDWKWDRLADHIKPLAGTTVLDVGCGSGYHCLRAYGAGAQLVVGIEPSLLYVMQFQAIRHFTGELPVHVLPFALEDLPAGLQAFDTVFSMGVLYHRRSPFDHLFTLKGCLKTGGELVLETLVIEGPSGQVLVPAGRYAKMRNVWFIPSTRTLEQWLRRAGFTDVRLIDVAKTTVEEQRSTGWMNFESLADFLDPNDHTLTIEGLPAPRRAIFLAKK